MANYLTTDTDLTSVADAIRTKGGTSAALAFPAGFVQAIADIPSGGSYPDYTNILKRSYSGRFEDSSLTYAGRNAFYYCRSITALYCTALVTTDVAAFSEDTKIETAVLPVLEQVGQQAFNNCSKLASCDFKGSSSTGIVSQAFTGCSVLNMLVIRGSNVCKLGNTAAFNSSPFASGKAGGTLYVPSSLISSYQSASNWSTILGYANNQIKSIESTHTDPTAPIDLTLYYADGTPIPTT